MAKKQMRSLAVEENERVLRVEEERMGPMELVVKVSLKDITREEKIREAGKLLYLRRYE
ncbi:hypothetical protein KAU87_02700 [Candidatus Bathyarchaeota archaeon]|nr:hypothetical protein [Candidatus Bathyarchaeota archaeon]